VDEDMHAEVNEMDGINENEIEKGSKGDVPID